MLQYLIDTYHTTRGCHFENLVAPIVCQGILAGYTITYLAIVLLDTLQCAMRQGAVLTLEVTVLG
jgi:hypothetical protein